MPEREEINNAALKEKIHEIIFEADTRLGKMFDIILLIAIVISVLLVILESVPRYQALYGNTFYILEFFFTGLFTIEYLLRLYSIHQPKKYAKSFFGVIDLLSILPFYISLFIGGTQSLMVIRGLRLLRIFRVFKLGHYIAEAQLLVNALRHSSKKILIFMIFIIVLVCIFGSMMYLIEGRSNSGFDSIPSSMYWAVVTLTTVGYGDISPTTPFGQFIAALIMISGYSIIAVPTGIVTAEVFNETKKSKDNFKHLTTQSCTHCSKEGHDADASHCKYCGEEL